jgi:hypothetical protein
MKFFSVALSICVVLYLVVFGVVINSECDEILKYFSYSLGITAALILYSFFLIFRSFEKFITFIAAIFFAFFIVSGIFYLTYSFKFRNRIEKIEKSGGMIIDSTKIN